MHHKSLLLEATLSSVPHHHSLLPGKSEQSRCETFFSFSEGAESLQCHLCLKDPEG